MFSLYVLCWSDFSIFKKLMFSLSSQEVTSYCSWLPIGCTWDAVTVYEGYRVLWGAQSNKLSGFHFSSDFLLGCLLSSCVSTLHLTHCPSIAGMVCVINFTSNVQFLLSCNRKLFSFMKRHVVSYFLVDLSAQKLLFKNFTWFYIFFCGQIYFTGKSNFRT